MVGLVFLTGFSSCKQKEKPVGITSVPQVQPSVPPESMDTTQPQLQPQLQPAVKPVAQPESTRIAYNGLETFMRGRLGAGERKTFLLRVRKDQQVQISLDAVDTGMLVTVLDEQGAAIGNSATSWLWTTTYAGDLQVIVFSKSDSDYSGQKEFTLRIAPN
jgi:hypothetical protein